MEYDELIELQEEIRVLTLKYWHERDVYDKKEGKIKAAVKWITHIETGHTVFITRSEHANKIKEFIDNL